jgi:hypothetical protein
MKPLILEIPLPEYKLNEKPDCLKVGPKLDDLLQRNFFGKSVVIRCISTQDHPGKTLDELTSIVVRTGTDKYGATRTGVGYQVGIDQGKQIDFFGTSAEIASHTDVFTLELLNDFYYGAQGDRGHISGLIWL